MWWLALLLLWQPAERADERARMVREQMEERGIRDRRVLDAIRAVPRHLYMPEAMRQHAYMDSPLPIGHRQTISQPYIVALMTEALAPKKTDRVLEIGTGSGYQAAVLARLVDHVYTIEIVPELARTAEAALKSQGVTNVTVRAGDGYKGWPEHAPFDAVILTAAPPEIPQALLDQLKPGGRLVAPVGETGAVQELILYEKERSGKVRRRSLGEVRFVPMVRK